tara:strand:- start:519 stop:755 length:237 start_codon:yes stop_codon:yes gene_type:complete
MNKKHKIWQSHIPGQPLGASVVKGDVGFAIRFWKRALKDAGTLQELKERRYFKKKSSKRREQMDSAKYFQRLNSKQDY